MDRKNENTGFAKRAYIPMDDAEIFRAAERMMSGDKVFLDPHLTMEALADRIGVHRNSLSRAVNSYAGENFASWLARCRVEEAERLAASVAGSKMKLTGLALRAGFGSHTSFYRAVRAIRGATPSEIFGNKHENIPLNKFNL